MPQICITYHIKNVSHSLTVTFTQNPLTYLSSAITVMLITTEWLIQTIFIEKKKKAQLKSISEADCSKSNPKGDHWKMWNWYNSDTEDWQVCISAETKLWHIQVLQLPGVLGRMVKMSNYEKGRISDQKLSVKLDIIPPCPPWIYSSIALCKLYF